jgi:hypothetical protein
VMGARWAHHDDVVRMAAAFRPALQARGVPKSAYLDYADPPVMPTRAPEPVRRKGCGRHRVGIISGCSG